MKSEKETLTKQISRLNEEKSTLENDINSIKQQITNNNEQNLVSQKDNEEAKLQIDELVNEIEQCIALLK